MNNSVSLPIKYSEATPKQRKLVREQYVDEQDGLCYWCNTPLNGKAPKFITDKKVNWKLFPPGFLRNPIHLQHNHDSDLTEGAVHAICNAVMWQYHRR
jgi:hypothetical protein|tara:strand:- start:60 stop:353 length:294 start_codon:yes stop_codon:yes gene_type:complete